MWLATIAADVMWTSFEVAEEEDLTVEDTATLVVVSSPDCRRMVWQLEP